MRKIFPQLSIIILIFIFLLTSAALLGNGGVLNELDEIYHAMVHIEKSGHSLDFPPEDISPEVIKKIKFYKNSDQETSEDIKARILETEQFGTYIELPLFITSLGLLLVVGGRRIVLFFRRLRRKS